MVRYLKVFPHAISIGTKRRRMVERISVEEEEEKGK